MTIIGNLTDNAIAAVADESDVRRLVRIRVIGGSDLLTVEVRDWGSGLKVSLGEAIARGATQSPITSAQG